MSERTLETGYFGSVGMGDPQSSFVERTLGVSWDFGKKPVPQNKTIPLLEIPKGFCIDRISVIQTKNTEVPATVTFGIASDDSVYVGGNFAFSDNKNALLRSSQSPNATGVTVTKTNDVFVSQSSTWTPSTSAMKLVTGVTGGGDNSLFVGGADTLCLVMPTTLIANWAASTSYAKGALVKVAQGTTPETYKVYSSKSARTSGAGTFDATEKANWDEIDVSATTVDAGAFDLCIHGFEVFSEGEGANALNRDNYRDTMQTANNVSGGMWPLD